MLPFTNLSHLLSSCKDQDNREDFLHNLNDDDTWNTISSHLFYQDVLTLAAFFHLKGVQKGTTVGIVSNSSPFWLIVDMACHYLGAISVPIFANIASYNLKYEIEDASIEYIYIASQEKYDQIASQLNAFKLVLTHQIVANKEHHFELEKVLKLALVPVIQANIQENDIATLIYTSGSTGKPKGVALSHKNLVTQVKDTASFFQLNQEDIILSFLPLAHIFERMVMYFYIYSGVKIYFADDVKQVGELMKRLHPNVITVVPRLLEKIYSKMDQKLLETPWPKKVITLLARWRLVRKLPNKKNSFIDKVLEKLVYKKLLEAFGGKLHLVICGGAPLSYEMYRFFLNMGLPLYQGYGLTEASPVVAANYPNHSKCGSCGLPFNHVEIKINEDKELLVRGDSVMLGYHNQELKTQATIKEGWLHTGDMAEVDGDGYLTITGRKKELYKTSTGKYVASVAIEQKIVASRWIDHVVVVADNRPFVTALIYPEKENMGLYAEKKGIIFDDKEMFITNKKLTRLIYRHIRRVNTTLNQWERIRDFRIIAQTPTIEEGVLTPSMKVARGFVLEKYAQEINQIYGGLS